MEIQWKIIKNLRILYFDEDDDGMNITTKDSLDAVRVLIYMAVNRRIYRMLDLTLKKKCWLLMKRSRRD